MAFAQTTRLTSHQQTVLAKIKSSPTPVTAFGEIAKGDHNLIKAKNMLADPQQFNPPLIMVNGNQLSVSEAGEKMMKDENLIDDSGELTDQGKNLAYDSDQPQSGPAASADAGMDGGSPLGGEADASAPPPMESFSLIDMINQLSKLK
jgi:hypothetical protein